jgi:hypothetical protein
MFILPNFPRTTNWLTEDEREFMAWRMAEDAGSHTWTPEEKSFSHGIVLAIRDPKVSVLTLIVTFIVTPAAVTNFFPSVVQTLKYSPIQTLLLTTPPYVLAVGTTLLNAWHADRTGERFLHISLPLCVAVAAFVMAMSTMNTAVRYLAMMLMVPSLYTGYVVCLAWISNCLPKPPAKRAAALALINAIGNASTIWVSYLYPESSSPRYCEFDPSKDHANNFSDGLCSQLWYDCVGHSADAALTADVETYEQTDGSQGTVRWLKRGSSPRESGQWVQISLLKIILHGRSLKLRVDKMHGF